MNPTTIQKFVTQARRCAMEMLITGSHIQRELPRVEMPETLRDSASQACTQLIATPSLEIFPPPAVTNLITDRTKVLYLQKKSFKPPLPQFPAVGRAQLGSARNLITISRIDAWPIARWRSVGKNQDSVKNL